MEVVPAGTLSGQCSKLLSPSRAAAPDKTGETPEKIEKLPGCVAWPISRETGEGHWEQKAKTYQESQGQRAARRDSRNLQAGESNENKSTVLRAKPLDSKKLSSLDPEKSRSNDLVSVLLFQAS